MNSPAIVLIKKPSEKKREDEGPAREGVTCGDRTSKYGLTDQINLSWNYL